MKTFLISAALLLLAIGGGPLAFAVGCYSISIAVDAALSFHDCYLVGLAAVMAVLATFALWNGIKAYAVWLYDTIERGQS